MCDALVLVLPLIHVHFSGKCTVVNSHRSSSEVFVTIEFKVLYTLILEGFVERMKGGSRFVSFLVLFDPSPVCF